MTRRVSEGGQGRQSQQGQLHMIKYDRRQEADWEWRGENEMMREKCNEREADIDVCIAEWEKKDENTD